MLIKNFDAIDSVIYENAIKQYEKKYPEKKGQLYIKKRAYPRIDGIKLDNCYSLHATYSTIPTIYFGIPKFLKIFDQITINHPIYFKVILNNIMIKYGLKV